jgi:5'(3')-deoxyribonucleotidase
LIILVDIDGVIVEYDFKALFKKYFNADLPVNGIFAYDLADVAGVSPIEIDEMFKEQVWGEPQFIDGAMETLTAWKGKHTIGIISNRLRYMSLLDLTNWLLKYKIPFDFVLNTTPPPADYHIDDSPAKLMKAGAKHKLLFTQEWNKRCLNITGELKRVTDWGEIRGKINK